MHDTYCGWKTSTENEQQKYADVNRLVWFVQLWNLSVEQNINFIVKVRVHLVSLLEQKKD